MGTRSDKESRQQLRLKKHEPAARLITHVHVSSELPTARERAALAESFSVWSLYLFEDRGIWIWLDKHYRLRVVRWSFSRRQQYFSFENKIKRLTRGGGIKWTQISLCKETADGRRAEKVKELNKTTRRRRGRMWEDHLRMLGGK